MDWNTVRPLRQTPGITTTLARLGNSREQFVLRRLDLSMTWPWSQQWLESELEATRRARLPHVVPTNIAQRGHDYIDLVRPYIAGLDLREWSAQQSRQSSDAYLQLMCDLFFALARLHRMGIAHGGVKSANILLAEGKDELILLDASVTRTQLAALTHPLEGSEAPHLLPERHGLAYPAAGFAADIYAAGWALLESLAEINRTASALRRVNPRDDSATDLSHLIDIVGVPAALRPIFQKLLDRDADLRYESAEDVLAALEAVVATGSAQSATADPFTSLVHGEPPLVGRQRELSALVTCADGASHSTGSVTCLSGDSGMGKSRLLDAVVAHADEAGRTVLRAGAFDHAPARPLGLFAAPLRTIVDYLTAHPLAAERVRNEMGALVPAAVEQAPELAEALGDQPRPDAIFADSSVAAGPTAIAQLLTSVFTEEHPGLIVLDDCQWADDLSWQVLAQLAAAISRETKRSGIGSNVSLIVSCRPEAVAQVLAWGVDDIGFVELEPLSDACTEELIRSLSDYVPSGVIPYVTKYSQGNPLETLLVFQALIDSSALTRKRDRWVFDGIRLAELPPQQLARDGSAGAGIDGGRNDAFLSSRLRRLSPAAEHALGQGAVLGRRFSSRLLSMTLETGLADVEQLLGEAVGAGIVRGVDRGDRREYEFSHDRIREAVLRNMTEDARRELHRRAAQALENREDSADYDIAYHFDRAGRAESALPFALRAGEAGLRRNALDVAERNFKIAAAGLALRESAEDIATFRVYEGLGTIHMLRGNYDLAAKELISAHALAGVRSRLDSARVATLLGELAFKTGRFDDAERWMQRSLHDLQLRIPRSTSHAALLTVAELGLLALGWCARRLRRGKSRRGTERDRLAAHIHTRRVYEWWFVRSPIWVLLGVLRSARFANVSGGMRERAQAYSSAAVISGTAPLLAPLALRLVERSLQLRQSAGDGWGIAQSHHFRGFVLYAANRYEEAIEAFDAAVAAFDIFGDRWEQVAAMWQKALCLARLGRLHEAGVLARDAYWEGKRRGDRIGAGTALAIWVQCLPGDVNVETIARELQLTDPSDRHTLAMLHAARGWRLFHTNQHAPALDAFRQADELIRVPGLRNHFLASVLTAHLQVLRLTRAAGPEVWTEESRQQSKIARRLLARARRSAMVFGGERPAVLREWALRHFSRGNKRRGRLILEVAARFASRYHAHGELAACSLAAGLAGLHPRRGALSGLPPVAQQCQLLGVHVDGAIVTSVQARDAFAGARSSRHDALLDAVNSIVASDDADEVLDKLRDATFATTTARRVQIVQQELAPDDEGRLPKSVAAAMRGVEPSDEGWDMRVTERLARRVGEDGHHATSVVAAFPLGEGETHRSTVEVLAALAGAVIERESLRRESMERMVAVQEAERGRIARDLHDEFGHLFASVTERLSALQECDSPTAHEVAADIKGLVREGIQVARSVAWSLRPSGLDDLGLFGCVEQYVEDCRQIYPIRIELTTTRQPPTVPSSVATAIFRIVQEALTNVGRHSGASEASVMVIASGGALRAVIEDDGQGFDVDVAGQRRSLGLIGMRDRARLVGGRLTVESRPGHGTTIVAEVPISR
ncbi:ATPase [Nocardioides gansuensis]|uniref:histidine kinase n=1 Tax=Nocardioides gansuensis TaxID=2138300 RepID=A0A2T8FBV7_9ACTN|nr:AAA family ATPase [Nocardioides gansuensis]PVG83185.1 ATPase [Nocardioides gansuensis]